MRRRALLGRWELLALIGFCVSTTPASAQTDEQRAAARSLATEGASAFKEARYKDAVDLFGKAESLVHAPPHLLFLARSYTKLGQLVKAREAYLKIAREDLAPGVPQAFRDAKSAAAREVGGIESKIGGLTIKIEGADAAKDLTVKIDGTIIPSVLIGASQPVDPGEHRVEATATGWRAQPRSLMVGEGEKTSVSLKLEADAGATPAAVSAVTTVAGPGTDSPASTPSLTAPPGDTGTSGGSSGMRIGAYSAFGIGAVGLGLGTVFLLKSSSKRSEADDLCKNGCMKSMQPQIDQIDSDADSARNVGVAGLVIGGVGVATGVALWVLSSGSDSEAKAASILPWIGVRSAGVTARF